MRAALANSGFRLEPRKITNYLAPGDVRKEDSAFDPAVRDRTPGAYGLADVHGLVGACLVGELGVDGEVRPVRGVLSLAMCCAKEGVRTLIVPPANARDALVDGIDVRTAPTLLYVVCDIRGGEAMLPSPRHPTDADAPLEPLAGLDFANAKGQEDAKRVLVRRLVARGKVARRDRAVQGRGGWYVAVAGASQVS